MLQRLQRHRRQMTSVSFAFKGLTRTDLPQIEQDEIRAADRVGASCVTIIQTSLFQAPPLLLGGKPILSSGHTAKGTGGIGPPKGGGTLGHRCRSDTALPGTPIGTPMWHHIQSCLLKELPVRTSPDGRLSHTIPHRYNRSRNFFGSGGLVDGKIDRVRISKRCRSGGIRNSGLRSVQARRRYRPILESPRQYS
jgi:hypothetical protein